VQQALVKVMEGTIWRSHVPTEDASAVTFGLNHDLLDGVGGNVVLENSMPVNLMRITLPPATLLCTALAMVLLAGEASQAQSNLPVCPLIATGGTIAMKIDPIKQAPVPAISGEDLLATVPEVAKHARVEVKNVSNVPSDYMDPPRWIALTKEVAQNLERPEVAGVVVSHGTDTLEETAWWLDLTINSEKPVILIGAQRNASEKDFDGPRNLLNAVRICVDPQSKGKGAMIALNTKSTPLATLRRRTRLAWKRSSPATLVSSGWLIRIDSSSLGRRCGGSIFRSRPTQLRRSRSSQCMAGPMAVS
jgi:hypothetical protein